jgi:hypothetical protein
MDNGLNTWARSLDVIHEQALCFPTRDKNCLHISEMLRLQQAQKCTNVQFTSPHGSQDDSILSAKLIRIVPETSSV